MSTRPLLPLSAAITLLATGCDQSIGQPAPSEFVPADRGLDELVGLEAAPLFEAAAAEAGVPADLLAAIAYVQTGLGAPAPRPGDRGVAGILGLDDGQVRLAAGLAGVPEGRLRADREAQLLGGALLLDSMRDRLAPAADEPSGAWWPVLAAWPGLETSWAGDLFAAEVMAALQRGVVVATDRSASEPADEEIVVIAPRETVGLEDLVPEPPPAGFLPDYGPALLHLQSPGTSPRGGAVERIVLATAEDSFPGALAWTLERGGEPHYLVRRSDGAVAQLSGEDRDTGAGGALVVAVAGPAGHFGTWTPAVLESTALLVADLAVRHDLPVDAAHVLLRSELGDGRVDPGDAFPAAAWLAMARCFADEDGPCSSGLVGLPGDPPPPADGRGARDYETSGGVPDVPYFYQYANSLHPSATCQNTSIAMVLKWAGWNGRPDDITRRFGKNQAQSPEGLALVFNTLAQEAGLPVRLRARRDGTVAGMRALLSAGKPVIVHGYQTGYGHVLVALGASGSDYVVNDPAGRWTQTWKGGYPYGYNAGVGRRIRYGRAAFEQAVATSNGSSFLPLWYHELTGVPSSPTEPPEEEPPPEEPPEEEPPAESPAEEDGAYPWAGIEFLAPLPGDVTGNPTLLHTRRTGGHHTEFWSGAARLGEPLRPTLARAFVSFPGPGPRTVEARNYSSFGTLLARDTVSFTVEQTGDLSPSAERIAGRTYELSARTSVAGVDYVEYHVDGFLLRDDRWGGSRAEPGAFLLQYTFSSPPEGRTVVAKGYSASHELLAEGRTVIGAVAAGGSECQVVGELRCGGRVSGDTASVGSDVVGGYPDLVGNYSGAEAGYTFRAPGGEIELRLVDAEPRIMNQDIIVLSRDTGTCSPADIVGWGFNTARLDLPAGTYTVVVDGFDGDEGAYTLEADCDP